MKKITLAYFGSPDFSAKFLEKLLIDISIKRLIEVKLVITQPDRPVGRKQILTPTPVKQVALKYGLKVLEIGNFLGKLDQLEIRNLDLCLIYFYGQIIPKDILLLPKYGFWNIHFSLLPKYRGPAPAVWSLINGDTKTGVSLVQTDEKLDHGDLIAQKEVGINPQETKIALEERLDNISYDLFKKEAKNLLDGKINLTPQNHELSTYAGFPTKQDGYIEISNFKFQISN